MSKHKPLPSKPRKVVKTKPWKPLYKIQGQLFPHYTKGTMSKIDGAQKGGPRVANSNSSNAQKKTSSTNKTQETKKKETHKQVDTKSNAQAFDKKAYKANKKAQKAESKYQRRKAKYYVDFDAFMQTDLYKTLAQTGISIDQLKSVYLDLVNNASFKDKVKQLIQSKRIPQQVLKALRKGNVKKLSKYTNHFTAVLDSATRHAKADYKKNMAKVMPYAIAASLVASSLPDEDII